MNSNPNNYQINGEFASSGNDNSTITTVVVPPHSLVSENTYTSTVSATSKWSGKQIRARITIISGVSGSSAYPGGFATAVIKGSYMGFDISAYVFIDVSRVTDTTIRLRIRTLNTSGVPSLSVPGFTVEARVRTIIGN